MRLRVEGGCHLWTCRKEVIHNKDLAVTFNYMNTGVSKSHDTLCCIYRQILPDPLHSDHFDLTGNIVPYIVICAHILTLIEDLVQNYSCVIKLNLHFSCLALAFNIIYILMTLKNTPPTFLQKTSSEAVIFGTNLTNQNTGWLNLYNHCRIPINFSFQVNEYLTSEK